MARLRRQFFEGDTEDVARRLLGCVLVRTAKGRRLAGRVVEVEAYLGAQDPASHAYRGRTKRNEVMFGEPGRAYVYFTMGMHWCLNVTTEEPGTAGAVLLRALEPLEGIETMERRRGTSVEHLTNGPAKLTRALDIDGELNGEDLATSRRLYLERGREAAEIDVSSRVGVSRAREKKWRFFEAGNSFVSKGKPSA